MPEIFILTAPIRSGKTTSLMNMFSERTDVSGFLCPDIDGLRKFFNLTTKEWFSFQLETIHSKNDTIIGKFIFDTSIFEMANDIFRSVQNQSAGYIIIDEIGKLELNGQGFEPFFTDFISSFKDKPLPVKLILVVRDSLLYQVIEKYDLKNVKVLRLPELYNLDDFV